MASILRGPTLGEQVYQYIREKIITEQYAPGQVIVESDLAQELRVSRTPVSNAVIMLKERGLIEDRGGRPTVLDLTLRDVIELYQCRLAFDGLAARLAADAITDAQLRDLGDHMAVWSGATPRTANVSLWSADLAFHDLIYEASGNPYLRRFSQIATDLLSTYRRVILDHTTNGEQPRGVADVLREHRALYERLLARDPAGAEAAARDHIGNVIAFLERVAAALPPLERAPLTRRVLERAADLP